MSLVEPSDHDCLVKRAERSVLILPLKADCAGIGCRIETAKQRDRAPHARPYQPAVRDVPSGVGAAGALSVSVQELRRVVEQGAHWAVEYGFDDESDVDHIEENGCIAGADPEQVSQRAWQRGREQLAHV